MSISETEFEKETLRGLDFAPQCDCQMALSLFGHIVVVRHCERPTRWTANMACCSHKALSCRKHRYSRSIAHCPRCKQWVSHQLRWRRI
jgi:hypothetical protein